MQVDTTERNSQIYKVKLRDLAEKNMNNPNFFMCGIKYVINTLKVRQFKSNEATDLRYVLKPRTEATVPPADSSDILSV